MLKEVNIEFLKCGFLTLNAYISCIFFVATALEFHYFFVLYDLLYFM